MSAKKSRKRESLIDWRSDCPLTCALDVLGDKWTLLIVRDLFMHGSCTYSDFLNSPENISTSILASRLKHLTQLKIIRRLDPDAFSRGNAYELTDSGRSLEPVIRACIALSHTNLSKINDHMISL
jgi:DNA-binding HxlR family transcriptional regulator